MKIRHKVFVCFISLLLVAGFTLVLQDSAAGATTIVVNTLEDELNTDGDCSLREAIRSSNLNGYTDACQAGESGSPDTITFDSVGTIVLTSSLPDIVADNSLVIDGEDKITISGDNNTRIILVNSSAQLILKDVTVMGGSAPNGGAIYNAGTLTIINSLFKHNVATDYGGSIMNKGTLTVTDYSYIALSSADLGGGIYNHDNGKVEVTNSTITHNDATFGGGIYNNINGTLYITSTNFTINSAADYGGGISNFQGSVTITDSTFSGNSANYGGAIDNSEEGTLSIVNSFLGGEDTDRNSAVFWGGGIHNGGSLGITKGTFFGNSATHGGGIYNNATGMLGITDSLFHLNNVTDDGGGISNWQGEVGIMDSSFNLNSATHGGGIYNHANGTLDIINIDLYSNSAGWGGGIDNRGAFTVAHSTFRDNSADYGGGIYNEGMLDNTNSTFSANSAANYGGGISNWLGTVTIANSTFSGNSALHGGAIDNSGTLTITNTILADSPSGGNCEGTITDNGHNIEDINTCGFGPYSWPNTDPLLASLGDNGGPTRTHALLEGSPAIDTADPHFCPDTDQRGFPRPFDGDGDGEAVCDVGAFEFQPRRLFLPIIIND